MALPFCFAHSCTRVDTAVHFRTDWLLTPSIKIPFFLVVVTVGRQPRFSMLLLTSFAAMALLLAAVGLYAVLSYMVAQRTSEMGLRLALGAQRGDVLRLVLERGLALAAIGIGAGLAASAVLTHFVSSLLYGVHTLDWPTYLLVTALFLFISLAACAVPAMRAANVDPGSTLREQ